MDVRCPQCQTLYELETAQLKAPVITLKCSQCQHVFRIETKQSSLVQENQRRWMIRAGASGDILYITGFDVLHQWLMQGKIKNTDEISRTGKKWTPLSEIGEFMPIFQVIESISNLMGGSNDDSQIAARITPPREEVPVEKERVRVETEIQYGTTEEVTQRARPTNPTPAPAPRRQTGPQELPPSPTARQKAIHTPMPSLEEDSWALGSVPSTTFDQETTSQTYLPKSRAPLFAVVAVALILGGIYVYIFHMSDVESALGMHSNEVVSLGDQKTPTPTEVPSDPFAEVQTAIRSAQDSALQSADKANAEVMSKIMGALRPKMSQALGLATEEAEVAAEGGGVDHKLGEAKRNLDRSRPQQALSLYQEVLGIDSRNSIAAVGVGWALLQLGKHDEAAEQFQRAVELDSRGDALIGLGSAQRQRGNLKEAMKAYDLYLGRYPRGDKVSIAQYQLDSLRRQLGMP